MPRDIEIEARIDSVEALLPAAAAIATAGPTPIDQGDTFFRCAAGRLKLRDFSRAQGELIFCRRADERGPKESFCLRTPTTEYVDLLDERDGRTARAGQARLPTGSPQRDGPPHPAASCRHGPGCRRRVFCLRS
jgi:hypothetical protein